MPNPKRPKQRRPRMGDRVSLVTDNGTQFPAQTVTDGRRAIVFPEASQACTITHAIVTLADGTVLGHPLDKPIPVGPGIRLRFRAGSLLLPTVIEE